MTLTWQEAVKANIDRTGHAAYGDYCADAHPDHVRWRAEMIRMATAPPPAPRPASPLMTAAKAAGRVVAAATSAVVHGESVRDAVLVDEPERERRIAICETCPSGAFDATSRRCAKCTCQMDLKARLRTEAGQCPDGYW